MKTQQRNYMTGIMGVSKMNLDFLDEGLPVEHGNTEAPKVIAKFMKYCKSLNKKASQLTEKELKEFQKMQ